MGFSPFAETALGLMTRLGLIETCSLPLLLALKVVAEEVSATLPNTLCTAASDLQGLLLGLKEIGLDLREMAYTARAMCRAKLHGDLCNGSTALSSAFRCPRLTLALRVRFYLVNAQERLTTPSDEDVAIDAWVSHLASLDMNSILWTPSDSSPSKGAFSPPKHRRSNVFNTSSKRAPG
ncbi:hypothetical protein CA14_008300 [Aspergillus flavus]|uniref:Uncharacterized protein n=1 Tax=Aspergillus flavus TaxID=5059 RepID=A0AB74CIG2_ASPFL|nr:hypothetical protein CA14_008300 [Aspergillus flavus]